MTESSVVDDDRFAEKYISVVRVFALNSSKVEEDHEDNVDYTTLRRQTRLCATMTQACNQLRVGTAVKLGSMWLVDLEPHFLMIDDREDCSSFVIITIIAS